MAQPVPRNAVILAAGAGSRLRDVAPVKPLALVAGKPLIIHAIEALRSAGVGPVAVVIGHEGHRVASELKPLSGVTLIGNSSWQTAPNGVSLLAAREHVRAGSLLLMADHLVSPLLLDRLIAGGAPEGGLALAVDRRLGHPAIDEADVTRVRSWEGRIMDIGKTLRVYDALDCGAFLIGPALVSALAALDTPSLSEGVRSLARRGLARAVDIGDAFWLDIDDARALALGQRFLGA